ncbi:MAG: hypothetical protein ACP5JH_08780 [Bacteroidota bacterium]
MNVPKKFLCAALSLSFIACGEQLNAQPSQRLMRLGLKIPDAEEPPTPWQLDCTLRIGAGIGPVISAAVGAAKGPNGVAIELETGAENWNILSSGWGWGPVFRLNGIHVAPLSKSFSVRYALGAGYGVGGWTNGLNIFGPSEKVDAKVISFMGETGLRASILMILHFEIYARLITYTFFFSEYRNLSGVSSPMTMLRPFVGIGIGLHTPSR